MTHTPHILTYGTYRTGFITTAAQANTTGSMTDPPSLLSSYFTDPKAAVDCHVEHPAAFISSMTEQ